MKSEDFQHTSDLKSKDISTGRLEMEELGENGCDLKNVKKGYKHTKFGWIPEGWDFDKSVNVIKFFGGAAFKSSDATPDGIKWLKIANVGINRTKWEEKSFLPYSYKKNYSRYLLKPKEVVMALTRPILNGQLKITKLEEDDTPALLNQRVARVEVKHGNDSDFMYYLLQTPYFVYSMEVAMAGTDPPNIGSTDLNRISIPLPPLPEQQKIAKILSTWEKAITKTEQLIAKKQERKKGLMQQLLTGKMRFPEFVKSKKMKETKLGLIPEDWEVKSLGELFVFKNGLNKEKEFFGTGTPILNYVDVYKRSGIKAKDLKGRVTLSKKEIDNYSVHKGDVFFTRTSETIDEIGFTAVILESLEETVFSGFVLRARPRNSNLVNNYKKFCFSSWTARKEIIKKSSFTTRALTNGKLLSDVIITVPSIPEQQKIGSILSTADQEINQLQKHLDKLKEQKKGLMQKLLNGEVRVKVDKN